MNETFNAISIAIDILEEIGYKPRQDFTFGFREYHIDHNFIRFQLPYSTIGHKRYCMLRFNGQQIHIHGSEVDCSFIDLSDPGSIDLLYSALISTEKPNGHPHTS